VTPPSRRLYAFFGRFLQAATADVQDEEAGLELLERTLMMLCECTRSASKVVRQRACTLIGEFLNGMGEDVQLLSEVSNRVVVSCLARTEDRAAAIRAAAAVALRRLALDPDDMVRVEGGKGRG